MDARYLQKGAFGSRNAGFPVFGVVLAAAGALLAALAVGERAGLPGTMSWVGGAIIMLIGVASLVFAARNADESLFLGRRVLLARWQGGVLLGVLVAATNFHLLGPGANRAVAALLLGSTAGLVIGHGLARLRGGGKLLIGEAGGGADGAPSLIQGVLLAGVGGFVALAALGSAREGVMRLTGWNGSAALVLVLGVPAVALAMGGLRGLLALCAGLTALIGVGVAVSLSLGATQLGALPLPSFSQIETLQALADARARLVLVDPLPLILTWLPPQDLGDVILSGEFGVAMAVSALASRALVPGLSLHRRTTVSVAILANAAVLLGLAAMAGYAVEAAGLQFVGASLQAPPPGLLEAAQQGLAEFCGARPATLDALRAACGIAPRALGQLPLERITLTEAFLWTGVPVALGLPAAVAAPARLGPAVFPMLGVVVGLWLVTLGFGRGILGRGRIAPGLASQRLGLMRLATALGAVGLFHMADAGLSQQVVFQQVVWAPVALLAGLAFALDIVQQGLKASAPRDAGGPALQRAASSRRRAAPRKTAQSA